MYASIVERGGGNTTNMLQQPCEKSKIANYRFSLCMAWEAPIRRGYVFISPAITSLPMYELLREQLSQLLSRYA